MTQSRVWRDGHIVARDEPVEEHLQGDDVVWVDLTTDESEQLDRIAELLGISAVSVEDAASSRERVKLDWYDDYVFVNAYAVSLHGNEIETDEVSAFVTATAIVTVHDPSWDGMTAIAEQWDRLAASGGPGLLYGLLDSLVDGHLDTVDALDALVEGFEDSLFGERPMSRDRKSVV